MHDIELFAKLLELESPWRVTSVNPDFQSKEITINLEWPRGNRVRCPFCEFEGGTYDHRRQRVWRHLDTMQFKTYLVADVPRIDCPEHGVHMIQTPWASDKSRFTVLFERMAIDVLRNATSQTQAMEILGLTWEEVHHIQERAVIRGIARRNLCETRKIGVDEKSFLKGQDYVSVMYNLEKGCVIDLVRGRKESDAISLFSIIPESGRQCVKVVTMDMWKAYVNAAELSFPNADIVHDRYHISAHLNKAVDSVRRSEMRDLKELEHNPLCGARFVLLKDPENWSLDEKRQFREVKGAGMKSSKAWSIRETFKSFWDYKYVGSATKFFKGWYWWATHSRLEPMRKAAHMLNDRFDHIITYLEHRVTNAVAEGLNSKIQALKTNARGFRNLENYRIAILFHCGGMDMYPGRGI